MRPILLLPLLLLAFHTQAQLPDPFFPQLPQGTRVEALAASGDTLFVAGDFSMLGPYYRQHIGAVDIQSGAILPWGPTVNGTVRGLRYRDGLLFLWGAFTQVNGQPRNNLAVLQAHTGALHPFNPAITFPGIPGMQTGTISSLDLAGDTLFLGGYFLSVNGQSRSNLAALTLDGTLLPWAPTTNIPVERMLVSDQTVYVGGPFTQPRRRMRRASREQHLRN
jgi:trimeric autotransporter adhesin